MSAKCQKRTLEDYDGGYGPQEKGAGLRRPAPLARHCARGDGHAQGSRSGHSKREIGEQRAICLNFRHESFNLLSMGLGR